MSTLERQSIEISKLALLTNIIQLSADVIAANNLPMLFVIIILGLLLLSLK